MLKNPYNQEITIQKIIFEEPLAFMLKNPYNQEITIQKIIFEEKRNGKRI